jgi:hypothetical protein
MGNVNESMQDFRRLAGIGSQASAPPGMLPNVRREFERGGRVDPNLSEARQAVREDESPRRRAKSEYQRGLTEGSIRTFDNHAKMKEALEKARQTVHRVLATVQNDADRYQGKIGSFNEKARADMYRADQELVAAVEALYAASEAIDQIETAKRAWAKEQKEQGGKRARR